MEREITKTAVITASTQGIGKAISLAFLQKGYFVFMNYAHNDEEALNVKTEFNKKYSNQFKIIKADLSNLRGLKVFTEEILGTCNFIDCLVLNAAITSRTPLVEITPEIWQKIMDVNLNIPFYTVQKFASKIKKKGRIIFMGALMGQVPHAMSIPYGVTKAAIHFLSKSLVKEFAELEITVNTIVPGFVDTPWQLTKEPEHRKRIEDKIALKRFSKPEEIALLCMSIVDNDYINGAVINIDGGYDYK